MPSSAQFALAHPSEDDAALAKQTKQILARRIGSKMPLDLRAMNLARKPTVQIPAAATRLLIRTLDEMSRGNAVRIIPAAWNSALRRLPTGLNVSRPTLIRWLNEGKIDFRKIGTHRRVRLQSVASYKRK